MKFYPSADDFTQALLVMLVTNFTSGGLPIIAESCQTQRIIHHWKEDDVSDDTDKDKDKDRNFLDNKVMMYIGILKVILCVALNI